MLRQHRVYTLGVGAAASVADGSNRVVSKVLDAVVPPFDAEDATIKALEPRLRDAMTEDLLAQYVARVQDEVGVDGFNAVWTSPETLPRASEISDPAAWVRRVHA